MERIEVLKGSVLTVQEVSSYLRVHPSTIYRMLKRNQLPAFRVGSDWRFTVEAIDQWRARAVLAEVAAWILDQHRAEFLLAHSRPLQRRHYILKHVGRFPIFDQLCRLGRQIETSTQPAPHRVVREDDLLLVPHA